MSDADDPSAAEKAAQAESIERLRQQDVQRAQAERQREQAREARPREGLDQKERREIASRRRLSALVVYEIIRLQGIEELTRPVSSLWWSGVAAGLAISTSVFVEGLLHLYLPDAPWRPLVENFGYTFGFLLVILGGFQLFTENTVTAILPLLANRSRHNLLRTARLWGVVFAANLAGTMLAALLVTHAGMATAEQLGAYLEISRHFAQKSPVEVLLTGVLAGFLIAALVWILPKAAGSEFWMILFVTYVIALGDMAHVVAGSTEVFLLLLHGELGAGAAFTDYIGPAFIGNVIGGSLLFSLIAYGQVSGELEGR
jgi:formate/nitrite transporter FocA (FNT family)